MINQFSIIKRRSIAGTVGFNAYDNDTNEYGIVTNVHVVYEDTAYYTRNNKIGKPTKIVCESFGNVDAAFIPFENQANWQPVRTVNSVDSDYRDRIIDTSDSYIQGDIVKNYGSASGETNGKILKVSLDVSVEFRPRQFRIIKDVVEYATFCYDGDSGGPFGEGIPRSGGFKLKGICFAGNFDNDGIPLGQTCGIKIKHIIEVLNITVLAGDNWSY